MLREVHGGLLESTEVGNNGCTQYNCKLLVR